MHSRLPHQIKPQSHCLQDPAMHWPSCWAGGAESPPHGGPSQGHCPLPFPSLHFQRATWPEPWILVTRVSGWGWWGVEAGFLGEGIGEGDLVQALSRAWRGVSRGSPPRPSPVLPEGQPHVLLHLLQAVVVRVDEVEGQGQGERAAPAAGRHP